MIKPNSSLIKKINKINNNIKSLNNNRIFLNNKKINIMIINKINNPNNQYYYQKINNKVFQIKVYIKKITLH